MEGRCPNCNSSELEFGDSDNVGNYIAYEFECLDCGETGKEWYTVTYLETVLDKDETV
jgi:hypothetical protein